MCKACCRGRQEGRGERAPGAVGVGLHGGGGGGGSAWRLPRSTGHSATSSQRAYNPPLLCPGVSSSSKMPGEHADVTVQAEGMIIDPKSNSPLSCERLQYLFFQLHGPREDLVTLVSAVPTGFTFSLVLCPCP